MVAWASDSRGPQYLAERLGVRAARPYIFRLLAQDPARHECRANTVRRRVAVEALSCRHREPCQVGHRRTREVELTLEDGERCRSRSGYPRAPRPDPTVC